MYFNTDSSLYDVLDIKPDASPQEVREAYLRTKAAYNKDSVALYTLISPEEREEMLSRIEEAYDILSSVERRREYDRSHGLLEFDESEVPSRVPHSKKIISIDRVPPMERTHNSESLLVSPTTDFTSGNNTAASNTARNDDTPSSPFSVVAVSNPEEDLFGTPTPAADTPAAPTPISRAPTNLAAAPPSLPAPVETQRVSNEIPGQVTIQKAGISLRGGHPRANESALAQEIAQEVEWRGEFLRKVREARRISIEEMSNITKVSKTYIQAIEEENFAKLPAPVFMRGFVTQMAKVLRLPFEAVAAAYMARYFLARPDKTAK